MKTVKNWVLGFASVVMGFGAWAAGIDYVDADGTQKTCDNYTVVTGATTTFEDGGWYVVEGGANLMCDRITVNGSAHLILADGAQLMTAPGSSYLAGVRVESGSALTVYGQAEGTGKLTCYGSNGGAGIGGNRDGGCGKVTINGGTVVATGNKGGAGIGGGTGGAGGEVVINGGTVTANGTNGAAGIGCGDGNPLNGTLTVGANVLVKAGTAADTIEVKKHGGEGGIALNGEKYYNAKVIAPLTPIDYIDEKGDAQTCRDYVVMASDVGIFAEDQWYVVLPGTTVSRSTITVNGSAKLILGDGAQLTIQAEESYQAGVRVTQGNSLTVYCQVGESGQLTAKGYYGAGIGGSSYDQCGKLVVNGGVVSAVGSNGGAGIGGMSDCDGGTLIVNRGTVTATGGSGAAGIGGGNGGAGGEVYIYGGVVTATGTSGATGIGRGSGTASNGTLQVGPSVVVKAGATDRTATLKEHGANGVIELAGEAYYETLWVPGTFAINAVVAPDAVGATVTVVENALEASVVPVNVAEVENWTFAGWSGSYEDGEVLAFADASARSTTFAMPAAEVTITANFVVSESCKSNAVEAVANAATVAISAIDAMNLSDDEKAGYVQSVNSAKGEMLAKIADAGTPTDVNLARISAITSFDLVMERAQQQADQTWTITASVAGADDAGTVTVAETSQARLVVDVAATVAEHWSFAGWTGVDGSGAEIVFADATALATTFVMPETNVTVTANFALDETFRSEVADSVAAAAVAAIAAIEEMNLGEEEKTSFIGEINAAKAAQLAAVADAVAPAEVDAAKIAATAAFDDVRTRAQECADRPVDPPPPVDPQPDDPAPVDPTPVDPQPVDPQPVDPSVDPVTPLYTDDGEVNPRSELFVQQELCEHKASTVFAGNVAYNGWVRDADDGSLKGVLAIKSAKPNKKTGVSKLSVTYIPLGQKKQSIKLAKTAMPAAGGNPVVDIPGIGLVKLGGDSLEGDGVDIQASADYSKDAALKSAYKARVAAHAGVWTFAFNTDLGYAALSVTVDKKGKGKLAGSLPDGTKVSLSSQGALGDRALAIPFAFAKKASFGFVFWVNDDGTAELSDVTPVKLSMGSLAVTSWTIPSRLIALPDGDYSFQCGEINQAFTVAGKKWNFPKHQKKAGPADPNPYGTKLAFTPKKGTVKGSLSMTPAAGGKSVKYTVNGVVVNGRLCGSASAKGQTPLKVTAK